MTKGGPPNPRKIRLQFDFTPEQVKELDELVVMMEASSRVEAIRRSYKITKKLMEEKKIFPA